MFSANNTVVTRPRSHVPLELWTPYVLIGVSCVIFLAGHFWCYHKRNRIRYLRKREEARVKSGLLERRRITTLLLARYQSDLGISPDSDDRSPTVPTTRQWDYQQINSEFGPVSGYRQVNGAAASDTMEIVLEGVLAASKDPTLQEGKVSTSTHQRNNKGLYTIEQSMAEYHQRLNRPALDNIAPMKQAISNPSQASHHCSTKIWPDYEPCHKRSNSLHKNHSCQDTHQADTHRDPHATAALDHTPQVIGIFNLADRCTLCGDCSVLKEKYSELLESKHNTLFREDFEVLSPTVNNDHNKYNGAYTPMVNYGQAGDRSKQAEAKSTSPRSNHITLV